MLDIFDEILNALRAEHRIMLATILSTSGSTPTSAFSKMLVRDHGRTSSGTVGGGELEENVKTASRRLFDSNRAEILSFHLDEKERVQGLICGGDVEILVEPIEREDTETFEAIKQRRNEGEDSVLATLISGSGQVLIRQVITSEEKIINPPVPLEHRTLLMDELHKAFHRQETRRVPLSNGVLILEPILGRPALVIFGGGHVSKHLCRAAAMAGFRVTIVDDRKEYANAERFPEAEDTRAADVVQAFSQLAIKPSTYIVIVTRAHQSDERALREALKTPAKYIGMIGSKRKIETTYERLLAQGVKLDELHRVHAPMGIEIGATTAEEISLSIVAQMIAIRRGQQAPYAAMSDQMQGFFAKRLSTSDMDKGRREARR